MHELKRMAYLYALGVDSYVSRSQLPGAAVTNRLAIAVVPDVPVDANTLTGQGAKPAQRERRDSVPELKVSLVESAGKVVDVTPATAEPAPRSESVPRFTLTAIVAGEWLWLEELAGPLMTEQVRLIQSMAQALTLYVGGSGVAAKRPDVAQFDWPIHNNHQLDLGEAAAQASVAGFVGRRLEQHECRGLVLLGQTCAKRVPQQELSIATVSTVTSVEMLEAPALKSQVWRDLLSLVNKK